MEKYALSCPNDCDFFIAVGGHDFEVMLRGIKAYDECPNCGAELNEIHLHRRNDIIKVFLE